MLEFSRIENLKGITDLLHCCWSIASGIISGNLFLPLAFGIGSCFLQCMYESSYSSRSMPSLLNELNFSLENLDIAYSSIFILFPLTIFLSDFYSVIIPSTYNSIHIGASTTSTSTPPPVFWCWRQHNWISFIKKKFICMASKEEKISNNLVALDRTYPIYSSNYLLSITC